MSIPVAYHASHEQFAPSHLLSLVQMAERAGFDAIHSSDHFHPWSDNQGHSGFSFSWIGAAMQATSIPFSMVCAPGQRYHPAIVAQAIATIAEMFPDRFSIELGSGEALNEYMTGQGWPDKEIRNQRLLESVSVIRRLLQGEEVTHDGLVHVKEAKLYSLPDRSPDLFCAALSAETSGWAGSWADGLLTTSGPPEDVTEKYEAFVNGGGRNKPFYVQHSFSFASTREEAIEKAFWQWKSNIVDPGKLPELYKPSHFDNASEKITREEIAEKVHIVTDIKEIFERLSFLYDLPASRIILHNVNRNHEEFISAFGRYKDAKSTM